MHRVVVVVLLSALSSFGCKRGPDALGGVEGAAASNAAPDASLAAAGAARAGAGAASAGEGVAGAASRTAPTSSTASSTATTTPPPSNPAQREVVVFPGAAGWTGGRGCTDVKPEDGCDSQWLHQSGQVARVFVVDVANAAALDTFVDKLAQDVTSKGGVVDRFTQNGLTLVRFLQPIVDEKNEKLASINYALIGRDNRAVHLITSVVAFDAQRDADERLRGLLQSASWTAR